MLRINCQSWCAGLLFVQVLIVMVGWHSFHPGVSVVRRVSVVLGVPDLRFIFRPLFLTFSIRFSFPFRLVFAFHLFFNFPPLFPFLFLSFPSLFLSLLPYSLINYFLPIYFYSPSFQIFISLVLTSLSFPHPARTPCSRLLSGNKAWN